MSSWLLDNSAKKAPAPGISVAKIEDGSQSPHGRGGDCAEKTRRYFQTRPGIGGANTTTKNTAAAADKCRGDGQVIDISCELARSEPLSHVGAPLAGPIARWSIQALRAKGSVSRTRIAGPNHAHCGRGTRQSLERPSNAPILFCRRVANTNLIALPLIRPSE